MQKLLQLPLRIVSFVRGLKAGVLQCNSEQEMIGNSITNFYYYIILGFPFYMFLWFAVFLNQYLTGIFTEFNDTNSKYKTRIRSRVSNLRDSKNPTLRKAVLSKEISAERMAKMPAEVRGKRIFEHRKSQIEKLSFCLLTVIKIVWDVIMNFFI